MTHKGSDLNFLSEFISQNMIKKIKMEKKICFLALLLELGSRPDSRDLRRAAPFDFLARELAAALSLEVSSTSGEGRPKVVWLLENVTAQSSHGLCRYL
jgi:hypothetical protein